MLCEIWAHEWRVVQYHFSSLCDFWECLLFLYKAAKWKNLMKSTWAWFPISLLTVPSFTSEALHCIVWLPTASDPVRLKSFFKQQSSLKDSMEGEMMPSKTEKPTQRNRQAGNSLETSLVTWLHHHRHFSKTVAMMGASWQFAWEKKWKAGCYLPVCSHWVAGTFAESRDTPKQYWRKASQICWDLSRVFLFLLISSM